MKSWRLILSCSSALLCGCLLAQAQDKFSGHAQFQATFSRGTPPKILSLDVTETTVVPIEEKIRALRAIVGTEPATLGERIIMVHGLGEHLSRDAVAALCVFVKLRPDVEEEKMPAMRVLKNDILDVLLLQATPPTGLTDTMIGIYRDEEQDIVSRDYAIQHLTAWHEQGALDAPDAKAKIRAALNEAVRERGSIAGTALLGLHRLSADDNGYDRAEIDRLALELARSEGTDTATRITAIQVCAERGLNEALPSLVLLAQKPCSVALRLSTAAAMRRLRGTDQVQTFQPLEATEKESGVAAGEFTFRQVAQKEKLD
jgi:hypothetical protein